MRSHTLPILLAITAAILSCATLPSTPANAQSAGTTDPRDQVIQELRSEIKRLEQRVDALEGLDQKVRVIDRKLDVQAEAAATRAREAPVVKAGADGFSIASPDHFYNINFGGILQGDGRFFTSGNDKNGGSTFFLNRVRPILTGSVGEYYNFNITPDFGQGRTVLQDAYLNVTYFDYASLRTGKYKAPLDLERLQSDRDLEFSERSEIQNLVPNRDYGADLHGRLFEGRLFYDAALMNGVPNNTASVDSDLNDGKDFVGRVFATPFSLSETHWLKNLGFGFGGSIGDERATTTSIYRTYGQSTWFTYTKGVTAAGQRYRYEPQAYYYYKGFGLLAAYAKDSHELNRNARVKKSATTFHYVNDYATFADSAYVVQGSYLLTGEDASYGWVKPYRPFDPRNGKWGAWELAARISNVAADTGQFKLKFADPTMSAKTATEYAFGVNWYLNPNIKWQFDYARTFFNWGAGKAGATNATTVVKDRPDESVFETQLQLTF
jgi:phosphate-selective porin OprO and OprP